jgi:hypothetical protein
VSNLTAARGFYDQLEEQRGGMIDAPDGWVEIIKECDELLAYMDPVYRVFQIKEKFGTLRYYFETDLEGPQSQIMSFIAQGFETMSAWRCQACGKYGETKSLNGWLYTACPEHTNEESEIVD